MIGLGGGLRRFKPYPAYQDSGVEWLGEIPAGWAVRRWRYCCRVTEGQVPPDDERYRERILVAPNHIESGTGRILFLETASEQGAISGKYLVNPGDLIYSKIRPALNKACIAEGEWLCSADMYPIKIICGDLRARFLLYFVLSEPFARLMVDESMRVAMPKVNRETLTSCPVVLPACEEQGAIEAFLDRETAKIDALVAKKERLIELLQEKRTARITRAVTKGLEPGVPMKDSGVEWLGEIPAHWGIGRLGHWVNVGNGSTPGRDESRYWINGSYPWLTSAKINDGVIGAADEFVSEVALRECHLPRVRAGSVLVAITGEGQTRGRAALLTIESTISQHLAYVTPSGPRLRTDYLRRVFESRYEWLRSESSGAGSTRAALTCEFLRSIQVAIPPSEEQQSIAAVLDRETEGIEALIAIVREAIDRLNELRIALISAAVTGKIDVRGEG